MRVPVQQLDNFSTTGTAYALSQTRFWFLDLVDELGSDLILHSVRQLSLTVLELRLKASYIGVAFHEHGIGRPFGHSACTCQG